MEELYGFTELETGRRFEKDFEGKKLVLARLTKADEIAPYMDMLNLIWGFGPGETLPLHEAVVTAMTGGLFLGAEYDGQRAGMVYVMPAFSREWGYHHHSNFLGFLSEFRSLGLGLEAKRTHAILAARDGVKLVTWTFDPLQAMNANFNFRKLGCVCRTWLDNVYGDFGGHFGGELPSHRLLVEWRLDSARVRRCLSGEYPKPEEAADEAKKEGAAAVAIPTGLGALMTRDREEAMKRLGGFQKKVKKLFADGYAITQLAPAGTLEDNSAYVFSKRFENED